MDMLSLNVQSANRPGILGTHTTDFLLDERGNRANQNLFAVFGAPDKMVGQFIRDMFGVLRIHTRHYDICFSLDQGRVGAA